MTIRTIDFGTISIRVNFTDGETLSFIEDCEGNIYEIKRDLKTNQPFAVKCKE